MDIRDKVVLITGASAGIGLASARRFAAEGARLVMAARSAGALDQIIEEIRQQGREAIAWPTDMRNRAEVDGLANSAFQKFGRIDVLINNAGQAAAGTIAEVGVDDFRQIFDLNVFGPLFAMQAVIPKMRQNGGGVIINISSMVSKMHIPGLGAYAATKAALNLLSDTARQELLPENIRVITVYPRMTATDFGRNSLGIRQMRTSQRTSSSMSLDSAEFVADKILEAALKEPAEQYMDM
jgi:NAD(P)-dependent dehydrogenase (short-subunit alcohol dehydrogenase family)